jgi:energy-coupling factor transporter ATP-binding protein EcfA2
MLRSAVSELGRPIVMVTHNPIAAAYADAVVFLSDGRIVDSLYRGRTPPRWPTAWLAWGRRPGDDTRHLRRPPDGVAQPAACARRKVRHWVSVPGYDGWQR